MESSDEERGLDPLELKAWRGLIETTAAITRRSDQLLFLDSGLSGSDYAVMVILHELGDDTVRIAELAERLSWEQSRLSHHLSRMERRALVMRQPCAKDRRGSEVALTAEGRRTFLAAAKGHSRVVQTHFAEVLTVSQLEALSDVMDTLSRHLRETAAAETSPVSF